MSFYLNGNYWQDNIARIEWRLPRSPRETPTIAPCHCLMVPAADPSKAVGSTVASGPTSLASASPRGRARR